MSNTLAYLLDDKIYINLTNNCTNRCIFCLRQDKSDVCGQDMWLDNETFGADEVIEQLEVIIRKQLDAGKPQSLNEIIFCGYGEPLLKLELLKEVAAYIRKNYPDTKIIITTSHETEIEILTALSIGANGYLLKDTGLNKIHAIIESVNNGAIWIDPRLAQLTIRVFKYQKEKKDVNKENFNLTVREKEVLKLLAAGLSNTQIAKELVISSHTAKVHVSNIFSKLAVADRVQAAVKAYQCDLCPEK